MITLEQVLLLEQKVESAVAKISALAAENSELRHKLSEIGTQNGEFVKKNTELSEILALYEEDQSRIEKGILNALDRLNDVENSVLKAGVAEIPQIQPPAEEQIVQPVVHEQQAELLTNNGQIDIF